ncbi:unnamed protein product [Brassica napus]|uniref:ABC-type xenobiotic transporter n=1 Tax=Brassica napus TaxID=3708 RepID=A0A816IDY1_BRANA|nr:unnamed protein product [Brassica napus]
MDFLGSMKDNGMLTTFLSFSDSSSYLMEPRCVSGFLHGVLLLVLFCSWVRGRNNGFGSVTESLKEKRGFGFKSVLFCSLVLSLLDLALTSLSGFYWYESDWLDEEQLVSLLMFLLPTVSWGVLSLSLHRCSDYEMRKSPLLLRIWLVFYLAVSCYSLVVVDKRQVHLLVCDIVSFSGALLLCYVAFFKKARGGNNSNGVLEEPLLNGDSTVGGGVGSDEATPCSRASLLSLLTFSWMGPLIEIGNKKPLDLEDVPQLHDSDSVVGLAPKFRTMLESSSDGGGGGGVTTFKLMKALFFSAQWEILVTAFFAFIYTVASYVGPALIDTFVQYLNGRRQYNNEGYVLVITFFLAKLVECLSQRHWFFRLQKVGIRMRSSLVAMIYEKGLTLSCHSKQGRTSGEIINLMTVDAERIGSFSWYMHDPWMVLLQVGLALWILYRNLGLASVAALIATILVMLVNFPFGRMQERFQEKLMEAKDNRMKSTSEILRNMRILKLQGWEMKFLSKVFDLRKSEEGWLKKYVYNSAVISFVFWGAPTLVSVSTFGACILLGIPLESGKILSALATFRILQEPIYNLPDTISMVVQTKVSLDRIASYLCLDNLQPDVVETLPQGGSDIAVEVSNSTLSWDVPSESPTLKDISFKVLPGMKVAVCGTVGSGKSSLLSSILGEVPKVSGSLKVCGTKAYVAQSPWIQSGKIEDNILFGKPMEREKYEKVLEACSLSKDLEILSFGDQTVIGERGINLSGGQKQRIQIARALYQDADIYLFDDPFSAVDAHTGSHLFKEVLLGLLSSKSVIYVTHQVEFLPAADLILASTDQSAVDLDIPYQFGLVAITVIQLIGIIGVMSQVSWLVFLVFIPVVAAFIWYQRYYIAAARELSRLVGVCKAPLIQHFAETISGSTTIRSFNQESRFRGDNMRLSDGYSRPKFYSAGAREWLGFRLDMLSSLTFAFSLVFLISIPTGVIHPSLAGLAVTYGLNLNTMQAWLIWTLCNLENKIISVERMLQYASVPSEPPLVIESNRPEQSWPSRGEVDIHDLQVLLKRGIVVGAVVSGVFLYGCRKVLASAGVVEAGYEVFGQSLVLFKNALPKIYQVLTVLREQGLILAALLSLSAFFSMAETSITTLWPWKVRELAEKEPENGVFRMLRSDVTRFLTTILIGTTVVNIAATALVTEAATAIFGEAGVSAATGLMTVAILLLTEITPKSVAVHNAQEVARLVVRPVAWLSLILYPVGRIVTYLSMGILKILGLKGRSEPYVTEDELKLMLRGAELSGAIEEEEQDMIENVLEIKDTHVREVMTPLVDVVAIDASGSLVDFHSMWVTHQYSRVPVFEQRIDNIVGIAYAMDLLDYVQKGDLLESTSVGDMAHKPAYFVPDSMSVWNLLREFRIRKVHMAVVLNEYGGTIGIVTLEDVVEEIVGEIFDENDSKEEIQKKTGYIVMRDEGVYDVDANTSIDQLSEELNMKMPEGIQYETVSGFVCEAFGYIPKTGESVKVVLEKENWEEEGEEEEGKQERQEQKEKHQIYRVEILAGNARKVSAVRFERVNDMDQVSEAKDVRSMVPKFVRKWSSEEDDGNSTYQEKTWSSEEDDGNSTYQDNKPENAVSDEHVLADK